jgi:molybdenum cofactor cytidylyltransferase
MAKVSAIVLAAGLSSRMQGQQKLFLPYREHTILEQVISELLASKAAEVIVVSSPLTHDQIEELSLSGITLVANPDHKLGMTTTIQKGVQAVSRATNGYMICLGDMPRITTAEYDQMIDAFGSSHITDSKAILLPFYQGQKGNPVLFASSYRQDIMTHQDMEGCRGIVQSNKSDLIKVPMTADHVLVDVDTPDDYNELSGINTNR